jgi:hypothetical protein
MDQYLTKPISIERLREVLNGIPVPSAANQETVPTPELEEIEQ